MPPVGPGYRAPYLPSHNFLLTFLIHINAFVFSSPYENE